MLLLDHQYRMKYLIFGKKKKDVGLSDLLDMASDAGMELEVGFGDEPEDLNEDDYMSYSS